MPKKKKKKQKGRKNTGHSGADQVTEGRSASSSPPSQRAPKQAKVEGAAAGADLPGISVKGTFFGDSFIVSKAKLTQSQELQTNKQIRDLVRTVFNPESSEEMIIGKLKLLLPKRKPSDLLHAHVLGKRTLLMLLCQKLHLEAIQYILENTKPCDRDFTQTGGKEKTAINYLAESYAMFNQNFERRKQYLISKEIEPSQKNIDAVTHALTQLHASYNKLIQAVVMEAIESYKSTLPRDQKLAYSKEKKFILDPDNGNIICCRIEDEENIEALFSGHYQVARMKTVGNTYNGLTRIQAAFKKIIFDAFNIMDSNIEFYSKGSNTNVTIIDLNEQGQIFIGAFVRDGTLSADKKRFLFSYADEASLLQLATKIKNEFARATELKKEVIQLINQSSNLWVTLTTDDITLLPEPNQFNIKLTVDDEIDMADLKMACEDLIIETFTQEKCITLQSISLIEIKELLKHIQTKQQELVEPRNLLSFFSKGQPDNGSSGKNCTPQKSHGPTI